MHGGRNNPTLMVRYENNMNKIDEITCKADAGLL